MNETAAEKNEQLIYLTSHIVAAHVGNSAVSVGEVGGLISNVHAALAGLGAPISEPEPKLQPAVSVRASVKNDHIVCLDCGRKMKMLKRHLSVEHGLSLEDYRQRWELPATYPMVAPAYRAARSDLAKAIGLGRKPGQKRGRKKAGKPSIK